MIIAIIVIVAFAVIAIRSAAKANKKAAQGREHSRDLAIAAGRQAADAGLSEGECPYHDDNADPGSKPINVILIANSDQPRGKRFWWLAGYRSAAWKHPESPLSPRVEIFPVRQSEGTHEFLYPLSREEKVAITGLSPSTYEAVIEAKQAGYATVTTLNSDASAKHDVGVLLWKLEVADLKRLTESLQLSLQGDRAAASDLAKAAELYKRAFEVNPFDAVAAMSCGGALAQEGNLREGLKWLERAHDLDPSSERIKRNLAQIRSVL
jgi:tetratricopeptide (TPR) repeat protein